jgi:hypothetical protein
MLEIKRRYTKQAFTLTYISPIKGERKSRLQPPSFDVAQDDRPLKTDNSTKETKKRYQKGIILTLYLLTFTLEGNRITM